MSDHLRLFIGIDIPNEVKNYLYERELQLKEFFPKKIKWVSKDNYHITLAFLGNIKEENINKINQLVEKMVLEFFPFYLILNKENYFANRQGIRVIFNDVLGDVNSLKALALKLKDGLADVMTIEDKPFKPHITLGRVRKGSIIRPDTFRKVLKQMPKHQAFKWDVSSIILFQSILKKTGPIYIPLKEYNFA